jgi:hypothetical protein
VAVGGRSSCVTPYVSGNSTDAISIVALRVLASDLGGAIHSIGAVYPCQLALTRNS